jgi:hypothetical protein
MVSSNLFAANGCQTLGHLVPYKNPMAESWDSVQMLLNTQARKINVSE